MGRKKLPYYRIVAMDSRVPRDGKYLENVGHYDPLPDPAEVFIDKEKTFKWLNRGAIPTETVRNLLQQKGLLLEWDLTRKGTDPTYIEEELRRWEVLQIERQKKIEAKAVMAMQAKKEKAEALASEIPAIEAEVKAAPKVKVAPVEEAEIVTAPAGEPEAAPAEEPGAQSAEAPPVEKDEAQAAPAGEKDSQASQKPDSTAKKTEKKDKTSEKESAES